jgi:predicted nuclease with TOPRIM domain
MKGLQLLLNSLGIRIEPSQIEEAFEKGKDAIPKLAQSFDEMNVSLSLMNSKLDLLLSRTSGEVQPDPIHERILDDADHSILNTQIVNGEQGKVLNA